MIRTRFAPSPTGYMHVGGLRTALYNFLFAKINKGKFILRIEDTDRDRRVEGADERIEKMMEWAGIKYDEGPYYQSKRLEIYKKYVSELLEGGNAYFCFCSPERLENLRKGRKETAGYDRHCRSIDFSEGEERVNRGENHVIRMKVPLEGERLINDLLRGEVRIPYTVLDDQVIVKSDGYPTYHFAVVVDDHLMKISHVIRGDEWLPSTPKHLLLYEYLGWEKPEFAHIPLLLNKDRSKLSKREGHVAVEEYREMGFLPEALINYLALLGWNPSDQPESEEFFSMDELIREFSIEKIHKSGAVFDLEKLKWMNKEYIKKLTHAEFKKRVYPFFENSGYDTGDAEKYDKITALIQTRITTLGEVSDYVDYFYSDLVEMADEESKAVMESEVSKKVLDELLRLIKKDPERALGDFKSLIDETGARLGVKGRKLFLPVRLALTGKKHSPEFSPIVEILGLDTVRERLDKWIIT